MICNYCGEEQQDGIAFCGNCGKPMIKAGETVNHSNAVTAPASSESANNITAVQEVPATEEKKENASEPKKAVGVNQPEETAGVNQQQQPVAANVAPSSGTGEMRRCAVCDMVVEVGTVCKCCGTKAERITQEERNAMRKMEEASSFRSDSETFVSPISPVASTRTGTGRKTTGARRKTYVPDPKAFYEEPYDGSYAEYSPYYHRTVPVEQPKKHTGLIALVIFLGILLIGMTGVVLWVVTMNPGQVETVHVVSTPTATPTPQTTSTPTPAPSPSPEPVYREVLYDSSLTYSRMEYIHTSESVDDETFLILRDEITDFDNLCADYMNDIESDPPPHLRYGSKAYEQQVGYKQKNPNLRQTYDLIDVLDARFDGSNYYVWAEEMITSVNNGETTTVTHHWVYRLTYSYGQWYVEDFTKDPVYK